jgi:hypothetical protein
VIVVVDTNQFHGDPAMRGHKFRVVLQGHDGDHYELVVPEVVAREVPKMFRREYESSLGKAEAAARHLRQLGHEVPSLDLPDADQAVADFKAALDAHLDEHSVRIESPPDIPLPDLLDDSLEERRPFRSEGRGFRDVLIWRTVRTLAEEDEVVLVTENWKDFAESAKDPSALHPHLREDLGEDGHDPDRVVLVPSLTEFIDAYVPVAEQQLVRLTHRLETDDVWERQVYYELEHAFYRARVDRDDRVTIVRSENASIEDVGIDEVLLNEVKIEAAYESSDELIYLEVVVKAEVRFGFVVDSASAEWLVEERADVDIHLWEETFAQGTTGLREVRAVFAVDYDPDTDTLGDWEKVHLEDSAD